MTEDVAVVARRPRRLRVTLLVLAVLALVALASLWLARKPIAANFIDRELARRGVPARYAVKQIGLRTQRLERVSIGDPANPDLTAEWVEVDLVPTFGAPQVREVRAGGVRLRGQVADGGLRLGAVDKLMPAATGGPFRLPDIRLGLDDARLALTTAAGPVDVRLDGRGNLASGFSGLYVAVSPELAFGECRIARMRLNGGIATRGGRPHLTGPLAASGFECPDARSGALQGTVDATLEPGLDGWRGLATVASGPFRASGWSATAARGQIDFAGNAMRTAGTLRLAAHDLAGAPGRAPRAELGGSYVVESRKERLADAPAPVTTIRFEGVASARGAALADAPRLDSVANGLAGTPLEPLARSVARVAAAAGRSSDLHASLNLAATADGGTLRIATADLSGGGARIRFAGGEGVRLVWPGHFQPQLDGRLVMSGEGVPHIVADLRQSAPGAPVSGVARMEPYLSGDSRVALSPVRFSGGRFETVADVSGPLAGGRVERATLPLSGRVGAGGFILNTACAPLAFERLTLSGLDLQPARLRLCPAGTALLANGRFAGAIEAPRLSGRLGDSAVAIAANRARFDNAGFSLTTLALRLGEGERASHLDIANLTGTTALSGRFAGASGRIGAVPLMLGDGAGDWRWQGGALSLTGAATISDSADQPRFNPLVSRDIALTMRGDAVTVRGTLLEPLTGIRVAAVDLRHDLGRGNGSADLDVAALRFGPALQPDKVTPLTVGVIANVDATLSGKGHIAWTGQGVTSTGDFHLDAPALAAPFGPVTGLKGDIRFTDLLGLVTAPDQVMTVATVNPGILVENGVVHYRLLPGFQLAVESARWPFAGGELTLRPTTLDFAEEASRHLTFDVAGLDAAKFVNQLEYKNLAATGIFDGTLPMIFDRDGGRIEAGRLVSRSPGGTISYVGEVSNADLGIWGGIAFDALKAIGYREMTIDMNGRIDGEMVSEIRFAGVSRGEIKPVATGLIARVGGQLAKQVQQLPFIFNIRIRAPFRGLLSTARSFYDPSLLINDRLGPGFEAQQPVQPPESETRR